MGLFQDDYKGGDSVEAMLNILEVRKQRKQLCLDLLMGIGPNPPGADTARLPQGRAEIRQLPGGPAHGGQNLAEEGKWRITHLANRTHGSVAFNQDMMALYLMGHEDSMLSFKTVDFNPYHYRIKPAPTSVPAAATSADRPAHQAAPPSHPELQPDTEMGEGAVDGDGNAPEEESAPFPVSMSRGTDGRLSFAQKTSNYYNRQRSGTFDRLPPYAFHMLYNTASTWAGGGLKHIKTTRP